MADNTQAPPDDLVAETAIFNAYARLLFIRTRRAPGVWQAEDVQRLDELRSTVRNLFAGIAQIEQIASGATEQRTDPITLNRTLKVDDSGSGPSAEELERMERALNGGQQVGGVKVPADF